MSPIKPENKGRYPADWKQISRRIRNDRAGNRCECGADHNLRCGAPNSARVHRETKNPARWVLVGDCNDGEWVGTPSCGEPNGSYPRWRRAIRIVLTTAHLDHQPENCDDNNLLALCQYCHNRYDAPHRAETRRATKAAKGGQGGLF